MIRYLALIVLASVLSLACTSVPDIKYPPHPDPTALADMTPSLVLLDPGDPAWSYCSAVWVAQDKILTAHHCVGVESKRTETKNEIGLRVYFTLRSEYTGVYQDPLHIHAATVLKTDRLHDLALLQTEEAFIIHPVAPLAAATPAVGDDLWFMGHPKGLTWTLAKGWVAAYREADFAPIDFEKLGPFLQAGAPTVYKGNSGGGAFNDHGELVGIASFMLGSPGSLFYVHLSTIKSFLAGT